MTAVELKAGEVVAGKYRVDRVLGEGAMGIVLAATDPALERPVAIKVLQPEYAQDPRSAARFYREAKTAAKIKSEHVCRVIDVGRGEGGTPYMVMEMLEGDDLGALVVDRGRILSPSEVVDIVIQACEAIAEAHAKGIVHRDLKPANLFLTSRPDGSTCVKVLDFGISKPPPGGAGLELTAPGSAMGSPLYMAPEQMHSAEEVDARADIWGLGAIMFELLTGSPPFPAESLPQVAAMVLTTTAPPVTELRPDAGPEIAAIVAKCLAREVSDRYEDVGELVSDLSGLGPADSRASVETILRTLSVGLERTILGEQPEMTHRKASATGAGARISALSGSGAQRAVFRAGLGRASEIHRAIISGNTARIDDATHLRAAARSTAGATAAVPNASSRPRRVGWVVAAVVVLFGAGVATTLLVTHRPPPTSDDSNGATPSMSVTAAAAIPAVSSSPKAAPPPLARVSSAPVATAKAGPAKVVPTPRRPAPRRPKVDLNDFGGRK